MRTSVIYKEQRSIDFAFQKKTDRKPVTIQVSILSDAYDLRTPEVHYLVTTAFFKILHELNVIDYNHHYGIGGLNYYVDVVESRSAVRAYLLNLKKYHVLGSAWEFAIIEDVNSRTIIREEKDEKRLNSFELYDLVRMHISMGSRPLRYSRAFLYAALAPFGRDRAYGSCSMNYEDARGERNFYYLIQAIEIIVRSLSSMDFSSISSLEELRAKGLPIEQTLDKLGKKKGLLKGLLFHSLVFASMYEKKVPEDKLVDRVKELVKGLENDFQKLGNSDGLRLYAQYRIGGARGMALSGYQFLFDLAIPFWNESEDLDELSLYLLSKTVDTTTLANTSLENYQVLQEEAKKALHDEDYDRDQLNHYFYKKGLVSDGISDLISMVLLLNLILKED